jgi:hypothetical protein
MQAKLVIGGLAAAAVLATAAFADTVSYKADLSGAQEVPPVAGSGTGSAEMTYDTTSKKLTWKVTYSGLTGGATAAHFHGPAEAGKNSGVAVAIAGTASPLEGSATLTDAQAADLTSGKWYVNVHTAANKSGEIRGQVVKK